MGAPNCASRRRNRSSGWPARSLSRSECERKRNEYLLCFRKTDPKASATLTRDREWMVTFFDDPERHSIHLRTTNIIESTFNAVRLRSDALRRFKRIDNAQAMSWKLLMVAQREVTRAQCVACDEGDVRRKTFRGRSCRQSEGHVDKKSRLISFTHRLI